MSQVGKYRSSDGSILCRRLRCSNEQDAIVALAGNETNRQDYTDLPVFDLITEHDDADTQIVCSAIYGMVCLMSGQPVPRAERVLKQSKG
jgi:hypothetical protein